MSVGQGNVNVNISGNAQGLVTAMNQAQQTTAKTMTSIQQQTTKTATATQTLSEKFAGNRGLIYSFGTIFGTMTGVVAEFQLLDDAQTQVAEATDKLREMEAKGEQGTTKYTQAQQQLEKASRFLSFTTRNLALALTNFVPEILLLITNLSKAKVAAKATETGIKTLGTVTKASAAATVTYNAVQKASTGIFGAGVVPIANLTKAHEGLKVAEIASGEAAVTAANATRTALIRTGIGALIVAAGTALVAYIENWGKFRDKVNEAGAALLKFAPILKPLLDLMAQFGHWIAQVLGNEVPTATDKAKEGFKGLSKEATEAAKAVQESWVSALNELEDMTKKDRLKFLKDLGFGKGGRQKIQLGIEIEQDKKELFKQITDSIRLINKFKLNPKDIKPWANNMIESLRDAMKDAGGKLDILQGLIDILKKNKGATGPQLQQLVAGWFDKLPATVKAELEMNGITEEDFLTGMGINAETFKSGLATGIQQAISDSVARVDLFKGLQSIGATGKSRFNVANLKGAGGGGFVDQFINAIKAGFTKESLAGAGTAFVNAFVASITWTTDQVKPAIIGFGQALIPLFQPGSLKSLGDQFTIAFVKSILWVEPTVKQVVIGFGQSLIKLFQPKTWESLANQFTVSFANSVLWLEATVKPIVTGLANQLIGLFTPANLQKAADALTGGIIGAGITVGADQANKWATDVGAALAPYLTGVNLSAASNALLGGVLAMPNAGVKAAGEALSKFVNMISTELSKVFNINNLSPSGTALVTAILSGATATQDATTTFLGIIDDALHLTFTAKSMAAVGELLVTTLLTAAKATTEALNTFLIQLGKDLSGAFNASSLKVAGDALFDGILAALQAIPDAASRLWEWLAGLFGEVVKEITPTTGKSGGGGIQNVALSGLGVDKGGGVDQDTQRLNVLNRQIVTITQNVAKLTAAYNLLARATVVVGTDTQKVVSINNSFARTIATVTQDANAQTKANNSLARTIVTVTKDVSAWTKANNTLARTIVTVGKDVGSAVKQMNTFARAVVTVTKDVNVLARATVTLAKDIKNIPSKKTITIETKKVTTAGHRIGLDSNLNANAHQGDVNITLINTDEFGEAKKRKFKASLGKGSYRFG